MQPKRMQLSSCWSVSQACNVLCTIVTIPINRPSPQNDTASLITYTTHTHVSDTNIYTLNPVESNQRDGPTGHKNH